MMNRSLRITSVAVALSAALAAPAWANPFETVLPNGMKLIVK
jgi:zinc protease